MRNAILLHGLQTRDEYYDEKFPAPGNAHWFPWLQKQLLLKDIYAETPLVPSAYSATYEEWKKAFERCDHIAKDTVLVGHSCGGGFILRWLSENKDARVGKVVLVAPWLDPDHDPTYARGNFFDFELDSGLVSRTTGMTIFNSDNDHGSILETVKLVIAKVAGVKVVDFHNYGHFCFDDMKTDIFPELLEECLRG